MPLCESEAYLHSGVLSGRYWLVNDRIPEPTGSPGEAGRWPEGFENEGFWDREEHAGIAIIANVRNPFERAVSAYRFFGLGQRIVGRRVGFDEFLDRLPEGHGEYQHWVHTTASYSRLLYDEQGPIYTHLIRFETLDDDFGDVVDDLQLPIDSTLEHMNSSDARIGPYRALVRSRTGRLSLRGATSLARPNDYRAYYTTYSRRAVEELYSDDLENFGYEF